MSAKSRPDLRVFPSLDYFLCLECGCTVEYPPTTKPPGYVEELCGRCFREMVDKATSTLDAGGAPGGCPHHRDPAVAVDAVERVRRGAAQPDPTP